jgi:quercetin dioxygenase-like cupin family protein
MERQEHLARGNHPNLVELAPGVHVRPFISAETGSRNLCTSAVIIQPGGKLPYHRHTFSEAITILEGEMTFDVEGRRYQLNMYDSLHVPAGIVHAASNTTRKPVVAHSAFATDTPSRENVPNAYAIINRGLDSPRAHEPEHIARYFKTDKYPLATGTRFRDLFAARFGSKGICGGYGEFSPGTGLPCHFHKYDESITIVRGRAVCEVEGRRFDVSDNDTVMVPTGRVHRFYNNSDDVMAMVWVYAGDEPERTVVDDGYCIGTLTGTPEPLAVTK